MKIYWLILISLAFYYRLHSQTREITFFEVQKEIQKDFEDFQKSIPKMDSISWSDSVKRKEFKKKWNPKYKEANEKANKKIDRLLNTTFPDFYFEDFNGKTHSLSDFGNQKFILNFNYTFCDRCIRQIDSILKYSVKGSKIIVLLHDKKSDADHIFEAYGDKILLGFIPLEYETYYTFTSGTPSTYLLEENRMIKYFDNPSKEDNAGNGLFNRLKVF